MRVIRETIFRRLRVAAVIAGIVGLMFTAPFAAAAYRTGVVTELNMSDGYVTLSGDVQYQLSMDVLAKLWHERNSGQLEIRPGTRVRLDLAPPSGSNGRGKDVVVNMSPMSGAGQ